MSSPKRNQLKPLLGIVVIKSVDGQWYECRIRTPKQVLEFAIPAANSTHEVFHQVLTQAELLCSDFDAAQGLSHKRPTTKQVGNA